MARNESDLPDVTPSEDRTGREFHLISTRKYYVSIAHDAELTAKAIKPGGIFDEPRPNLKEGLQFVRGAEGATTLLGHNYELPFGTSHNTNKIRLPLGLSIVSGATSVGKSEFFRALVRAAGVKVDNVLQGAERVIAVEPADDDVELSEIRFFGSVDSAYVYAIREQLRMLPLPVRKLIIIDSFRELLFDMDGPAGAKGIVNSVFPALTRASNSLARQGLTVLASVNPLLDDPEYMTYFTQKLSASVPCYIQLNRSSRSQGGTRITFEGSIATRPIRSVNPFSWTTSAAALTSNPYLQTPQVAISLDPAELLHAPMNELEEVALSIPNR